MTRVKDAVKDVEGKIKGSSSNPDTAQTSQSPAPPSTSRSHHTHLHMHHVGLCSDEDSHHLHRFQSFAPQRDGNDVKWYVDGCGYFWAVSEALEQARESVWILDWWLSPELYMRRTPAKNEQYRLDRLLFAAANRGVQVNVIVYKEVTQALTLSSSHTKHWLEDNDKTGNIKVFRHPDHLPDKQTLASSFWSSIKQSGMSAAKLSQLPGDFVKGIYGMNEDTILYWAHHEKLCVVDGRTAFMGGLDLCYGRWDTNQHSISDAHPTDLNQIVFPGQDYNNARIMDFQDVSHWQNNKLDRKYNSRMGWSDVSISLHGPIVEDLRAHFAQRWNFIYFEKYDVRKDARYHPIDFHPSRAGIFGHPYIADSAGGEVQGEGQFHHFRERMHDMHEKAKIVAEQSREQYRERTRTYDRPQAQKFPSGPLGGVQIQLMRSCGKWSHGVPLEHSIANAYIEVIKNSKHFVYMENQFFITATGDEQKPVKNQVGAAIVERIIRAARNNEDYHVIVNIPAIPGFAGDLKDDASLGTRAIMEFQYNSINRGGHSIMEKIAQAGIDPMRYIRFYNLRNYDRINSGSSMSRVEQQAGVSYDDARRGHDQKYSQVVDGEQYGEEYKDPNSGIGAYDKYQQAAGQVRAGEAGRWDSVADCYMLNGPDIRSVPWDGDAQSELDAFVCEELYIHSKLLIADDRVVICGSANMNDRSQLGSHDSEIAVLIEDTQEIDSYMAGRPWRATRFAASLRRQIFRKHLGLLEPQDMQRPDGNFHPVGHDANVYDWGSREDAAVSDPLSSDFENLWKSTAATNTAAFRRVFHPVPDDGVKTWKEYDTYFERFFKPAEAEKKNKKDADWPSTWKWGHVVAEDFAPDATQAVREVKEELSKIRGNLVEMPLLFLHGEDIAKEGLGLNALTEEVYT
ncbi:phospholipase D/nuclease [Teratosphaeria nubilosa]|uniref:Phospholipase n=1 Tax=Teratosphaeria nubilosa TaxID=161662 RepID=A0A6G1LJU0_9PEZI|nr:phospholipase D/nuclease [Teratosphaeria nubilosa]